jgi:non-specific serine/threonine protein kinase
MVKPAIPSALPLQPTPLVGRDADLAAACARLSEPGMRLLTLLGPPGVGKTRLALAVAERLAASFVGGVVFVDLAPVADPALVPSVVARRLGVRDAGPGSLVEQVVAAIGDKQRLLLLDNFEHLLAAAPLVSELLAACPGLTVLATSRAPLDLRWEHRFPVPPLGAEAARALFFARVRAVAPELPLPETAAPDIGRILARLDGLPLAIELAAARAAVLPLAALADCLTRGLDALAGGARDLPARQRTLRDTIAWSCDLLDAPEQALFRRLAVFAGGCTLTAAAAVYAAGDTDAGAEDVIEGLAALAGQNLLRRVAGPGGEPRVAMLETIREFALEHLDASSEAAALRRRHAEYFLHLAEQARAALEGPDRALLLDRLELEQDNVRAALSWALAESGDADVGLRLAASMTGLWVTRGYWDEGLAWLDRALAAGAGPPLWRARALSGAGHIAWAAGEIARAEVLLSASLVLYREIGEEGPVPSALHALANVAILRDDAAHARRLLDEAHDLVRARGDQVGVASVYWSRGWLAFRNGDYDTASACYETSLRLARTIGFLHGEMRALNDLSNVARHRRDLGRARAFTRESLEVAGRLGDRRGIAAGLASLAGLAMADGDARRAAHLYGAADAHLGPLGLAVLVPSDRPDSADNITAVRAALGETAFSAAWTAGRATSLAEIIAEEPTASPVATTATPARTASPDRLTAREVEVLRLLASGRSNREIAAELVVSVRTVEHHIASIYTKIGAHRRAEAVAYARRHGLLLPEPSTDATTYVLPLGRTRDLGTQNP